LEGSHQCHELCFLCWHAWSQCLSF
jgi:hypothetical protein